MRNVILWWGYVINVPVDRLNGIRKFRFALFFIDFSCIFRHFYNNSKLFNEGAFLMNRESA